MSVDEPALRRGSAFPGLIPVACGFGVLAAALAWFLASYLPQQRRATAQRWGTQLSTMAHGGRIAIDGWLGDTLGEVRTVAAYPTVRRVAGTAGERARADLRRHLAELLGDFVRIHGHRALAAYDAAGRVLFEQGTRGAAGPAAWERAFAEVAAGGRACVLLASGPSGADGVVFAAPIAGARWQGAIVLEADPERLLYPLLRSLLPGTKSGEAALARAEDGHVVPVWPFRHGAPGTLPRRLPLDTPKLAMAAALRGERGFGRFLDDTGAPVLAATERLENAPWGMVVKIAETEAYESYRHRAGLVAGVAGASALGLLGWGVGMLHAGRARERSHLLSERMREVSGRLAAQERLASLDRLYRTLAENIPNGDVFLVDTELRFLLARGSEMARLGLKSGDFEGRGFDEALAEPTRGLLRPLYESALAGQPAAGRVAFAGGEYSIRVQPLRGEDGAVWAALGFTQSITELAEARAELERSFASADRERRLLETLLDSLPVGVLVLDAGRGEVLRVNGHLLEITGVASPLGSLADVRRVPVRRPGDSEPMAVSERPLSRALAGEFVHAQELELLGQAGGTWRPVLAQAAPVRDDSGRTVRAVLALQDMSDVRRRDARIRALFGSPLIAIAFGDLAGRILDANEQFLRMTGYTRADVESGWLQRAKLLPPDRLFLDEVALAETRARGACAPYQTEFLTAGGERRSVLAGHSLIAPGRSEIVSFALELQCPRPHGAGS